ncbi:MAG: hypothetical protein OEV32_15760 [Gammaproteobacteria bacterium]|nr:hypothetical protein [Gammaproteobacteria bacterium]
MAYPRPHRLPHAPRVRRPRAAEYERRLQGVSYEEIAAEGGGILSTVKATRAASDGQLHADALARLQALAREGVATVEIKSGYGLDLDNELKMLRVARRLGEDSGLTVRTTLLAAHTVAPEFAGDADAYMDHIVNEILPAVAGEGLADAVDAYCESIAFDASQVERLFARAQQLELRVKLHADQLSDGGERNSRRASARCPPITWNIRRPKALAPWLNRAPLPCCCRART